MQLLYTSRALRGSRALCGVGWQWRCDPAKPQQIPSPPLLVQQLEQVDSYYLSSNDGYCYVRKCHVMVQYSAI